MSLPINNVYLCLLFKSIHFKTVCLLRVHLPIYLKASLGCIFCALLSSSAFAQYNFYKFSVGLGGGFTLPFADTRKANYSLATQLTTDYYFTPYLNTGLELQVGNMRGGEPDKPHFTNSFTIGSWNVRMQLGQFYDRYDKLNKFTSLIRGLYLGGGIGFIRSEVDAYRFDPAAPGQFLNVGGVNHDLIFPINVGANIYLRDFYGRDRWELNFNFQFVMAMEDNLDGGLNPSSNFNDLYNYLSTGVRYKFGTVGLDKRNGKVR